MVENPYKPGTAAPIRPKSRATKWLVWSGIVLLALAAVCVLVTVIGMLLVTRFIANSTGPEPSDLARGISVVLLPSVAAVPLGVLGIVLLVCGFVVRKPISQNGQEPPPRVIKHSLAAERLFTSVIYRPILEASYAPTEGPVRRRVIRGF